MQPICEHVLKRGLIQTPRVSRNPIRLVGWGVRQKQTCIARAYRGARAWLEKVGSGFQAGVWLNGRVLVQLAGASGGEGVQLPPSPSLPLHCGTGTLQAPPPPIRHHCPPHSRGVSGRKGTHSATHVFSIGRYGLGKEASRHMESRPV